MVWMARLYDFCCCWILALAVSMVGDGNGQVLMVEVLFCIQIRYTHIKLVCVYPQPELDCCSVPLSRFGANGIWFDSHIVNTFKAIDRIWCNRSTIQRRSVRHGSFHTTPTNIQSSGPRKTHRWHLENNFFTRSCNIQENRNTSGILLIASKPNIYPAHTWRSTTDMTQRNGLPYAPDHK